MSEDTGVSPQLRVGDAERRVVDDKLLEALNDGVLSLAEYDERSGQLWASRTRPSWTCSPPSPLRAMSRVGGATLRPRVAA